MYQRLCYRFYTLVLHLLRTHKICTIHWHSEDNGLDIKRCWKWNQAKEAEWFGLKEKKFKYFKTYYLKIGLHSFWSFRVVTSSKRVDFQPEMIRVVSERVTDWNSSRVVLPRTGLKLCIVFIKSIHTGDWISESESVVNVKAQWACFGYVYLWRSVSEPVLQVSVYINKQRCCQ